MPAPRFGKPRAHRGAHRFERNLRCDDAVTRAWWKRGQAYCLICRHPLSLPITEACLAMLEKSVTWTIATHSNLVADDYDDSGPGTTALAKLIEEEHPSLKVRGEEAHKLLWTIADLQHRTAMLDNPIHMPAISGCAAGTSFGVRTAWAREYERRIQNAVSQLTKAATQ